MERKEIIKEFLRNGLLLSPSLAKKVGEDNYKTYIDTWKDSDVLVVKEDMNDVVFSVRNLCERSMDVEKLTKLLQEKFDFLKKIIEERVNAVSIENCKRLTSEMFIIAMINKTNGKLIAEDPTSSVELVPLKQFKLDVGDVLGMKGTYRDGKFFVSEIIYPDFSPPEKKHGKITVEWMKIRFMGREIKDFNPPAEIEIGGKEKIRILVLEESGEKINVKEILKKRSIPKIPHLFFKHPPDLVVVFGKGNAKEIYKNIPIIYIGKEERFTFELEDEFREEV